MARAGQRGISLSPNLIQEIGALLAGNLLLPYHSVTEFIRSAVQAKLGQERLLADLSAGLGFNRCPKCGSPLWLDFSQTKKEATAFTWICGVGCGFTSVDPPRLPEDAVMTDLEQRSEQEWWADSRGEGHPVPFAARRFFRRILNPAGFDRRGKTVRK